MNQFNVFKTRGKKQTFQYGNNYLSITELLKKPEIVNYLGKDKKLTYASQRDKLPKLLREKGDGLQQLVTEHNLQNPPRQQQQQAENTPLYGAKRVRAGLPKKNTKGQAIGPARQPIPRRGPPVGIITINDENLTARQVLSRYPNLQNELQKDRRISEKSLHAKVKTWFRKNKITNEMLRLNPEIVPREARRLLGNNVISHYTINSMVNTSPRDFLNYTRNAVIRFYKRTGRIRLKLILFA